ncbi:S8 family serine peptidase [Rossellomorea aquimaris]|uniref:S8 family serine peptidase n=1 Tax=Rossellomorea aquimaris TaxID=189382 RepID=UPI000697A7DA|nr:S8 family serine peptidase [Rossellomorea aquimaris]
MKKKLQKATIIALGAGLISGSLPVSYSGLPSEAQAASKIPDVLIQDSVKGEAQPGSSPTEQALQELSPEQREALVKLQSINQTGLHLAPEIDQDSTEEISVIVEFKQSPPKVAVIKAKAEGKDLSEAQAKAQVEKEHDAFNKDLDKILDGKGKGKNAGYIVKRSYKKAFNGVSMKLPANQAKELLQSNAVKAVYSDAEVQVEPLVQAADINAEHTGIGMSDERSYLQVDKLHEEGFTGKGTKVGVLDTGIDYNHPDLKAAYKGGYDFVDNDEDPMETTYEDWKDSGRPEVSGGRVYYTSHGTHVSGTVAGQGTNQSKFATKGIAPDAELHAYRVLGPYGSGTFENVMAGIEQGIEDGMDVMNLSLSGALNDPMNPVSMAVNHAVLSGVTMVLSAGNSGNAMYTLGTPSAAALALTVGANDVPVTLSTSTGSLDALSVDLRLMAIGYGDDLDQLEKETLPIVYAGMGAEADFTGKDLEGKIALISRGQSIPLVNKILAAKEHGAAAVLLFNDNPEEGHIPAYFAEGREYIPTFSLNNAEGLALKEKLESGQNNFTFGEMKEEKTKGGTLAEFSSRGPSRTNYDIKPEVTAPGVSMMSTVPSDVVNGDKGDDYQYAYQRFSGTSMSAPVVAGISALLIGSNPDLSPSDIKTILMNTADPLSKPYSVFEQGAGHVDPYEAIHSTMEITVTDETQLIENGETETIDEETGGLSFGRVVYTGDHMLDKRSVKLTNNGKKDKTFDVKVQFQTGLRESKDAEKNGVNVTTTDTITVKGNKSKKTSVFLSIPKTAEKGTYEGYVTYTNIEDPSETYQIPFGVTYEENKFEKFDIVSGQTMASVGYSDVNPFMKNYLMMNYQVKGHIKRVDFLYVDPETDDIVGHGGFVSGLNVKPNNGNLVLNTGFYLPFIGDQKEPFSTDPEYLQSQFSNVVAQFVKPGNYTLRAVATDDQGNTFTKDQYVFVDNSAPEFSITSLPHGVYEYEEGQTSVRVEGSIQEENIDHMKKYGFDVNQASNEVVLYYNKEVPKFNQYINIPKYAPNAEVPLNPDGTFAANLPLDDSLPILPVRFFGVGISSAVNYPNAHATYFVKKGTPYVDATPDKINPMMGETVTYTIKMNHTSGIKDQTIAFDYLSDHFEIESVTVHPELEKKASVRMNHEDAAGGNGTRKQTIHLTINDPEGLTGTTPAVNVKVKVKDEKYYEGVLQLQNITSTYTNGEGTEVSLPSVAVESYVDPSFSQVKVPIFAEGIPFGNDFTKAGIDGYATDDSNNQYDGTIVMENNGIAEYPRLYVKLPITDKEFTYTIHVPGHFKYSNPFTVFKQIGDKIRGEFDTEGFPQMIAGDVNGDQVIDIMDAIYVQTYWGTDHRDADINFDGIVDMNDFKFIETNYGKQNPTDPRAPKAKTKYKNKTLETVKKELGS